MNKTEIQLLHDNNGSLQQRRIGSLRLIQTSHGKLLVFNHTRTGPEKLIRFINKFKNKLQLGEHVPRALYGKIREGLHRKGMMLKSERRRQTLLKESKILVAVNERLKLRKGNFLQKIRNFFKFIRQRGFVGAELPLAIHFADEGKGRNLLVSIKRQGKVHAVHDIPRTLQKIFAELGITPKTQLQYMRNWYGKKYIIDVKTWDMRKTR